MTGPMAARLLVDLDVVVGAAGEDDRRRARHVLHGTVVRATTRDRTGQASTTFDVADWQAALADACSVAAPPPASPAPEPGLEVPWDLVLGTGAALERHRLDLYDVLVARDAGSVTVAGRPLEPAGVHTQVRRLHRSVVGRLRCLGTTAQRRVGWVSWLLYDDGWRALTPNTAGAGRPMIRLESRTPADLARAVAGWAVPR